MVYIDLRSDNTAQENWSVGVIRFCFCVKGLKRLALGSKPHSNILFRLQRHFSSYITLCVAISNSYLYLYPYSLPPHYCLLLYLRLLTLFLLSPVES
ncbi:hypothetical protein GQ53DRAFT_130716 [Thozetella sp. PMI_491]|nr:hypothetical protein GQ53DRAFT_130716 [Thozetella sp. PMI_491]